MPYMFSDERIKRETYTYVRRKLILKRYKSLRGLTHFEIFYSLFGTTTKIYIYIYIYICTSGIMYIVVGNGYSDPCSNLEFHIALIPLRKVWIQLLPLHIWVKWLGRLSSLVLYGNQSRSRKTLTHTPIYIYIYISWPTVDKCDPKAIISIATTPVYRKWRYSFPWITALTLDLYLIMLSVKQEGIKYPFWFLTWLGIRIPVSRKMANIQAIMPMNHLYLAFSAGIRYTCCISSREESHIP